MSDEFCGVLHEFCEGGFGILRRAARRAPEPKEKKGQEKKEGEPAEVEPAEPGQRGEPVKAMIRRHSRAAAAPVGRRKCLRSFRQPGSSGRSTGCRTRRTFFSQMRKSFFRRRGLRRIRRIRIEKTTLVPTPSMRRRTVRFFVCGEGFKS